jgi:hypothetical protein
MLSNSRISPIQCIYRLHSFLRINTDCGEYVELQHHPPTPPLSFYNMVFRHSDNFTYLHNSMEQSP